MQKFSRYLNYILSNNLIMILLFMLIGITISINFRHEILFDFYNYHYFLPWAFFHNRTFTDIALAVENSYHNPLIDFPIYFFVKYFNTKIWLYYSFFGILWGLLIFAFYKICRNVLQPNQKIELLLALIIAMTGFATLIQIGTSSGEIIISFGIITAIYWLHKEIFITAKQRLWVIFGTGFLLGAMFGLKLTAVIYCLGAGLALILSFKYLRQPIKAIFLFALGGLIGFLCVDGFWMWNLYKEFGNPLFPYLNNIFKSEYIDTKMITYNSTLHKKSFIDYLIFPYLVSFDQENRVSAEAFFRDPRFAIGYTLLLIATVTYLWPWRQKQKEQPNTGIMFLLTFAFLSYIVWLFVLPISRYAIPIEMMIALLGILYFYKIKPKSTIGFTLWCSAGLIMLFSLFAGLPYPTWGRRLTDTQLLYPSKVHLPKNSLVLSVSYGTGAAAAQIAEDNPDAKFANISAPFALKGSILGEKIEEYKKNSDYIAYMVIMRTSLTAFDGYTPPQYVFMGESTTNWHANLKYIVQNEIGIDKFYCQDVSNAPHLTKVFLCIDKKDKDKIFRTSAKSVLFKQP